MPQVRTTYNMCHMCARTDAQTHVHAHVHTHTHKIDRQTNTCTSYLMWLVKGKLMSQAIS